MKRYLAETIELGLFLLIYLFPVHSFAQETVEQVLQFEHTVMNIGTLSEDDDPAMYHFKYHNVSKKPIYLSKLTTSCGCTVAKYIKTRSHTDGFQRNNAKCLDEKGISRFVPHSSI